MSEESKPAKVRKGDGRRERGEKDAHEYFEDDFPDLKT